MDTIDPIASRSFKNRPLRQRLGFAVAGLRIVRRRERSFRTQIGLAAIASLFLLVARPGLVWAALVALVIGLVLALEAINAALEYAIDRLHPELSEEIRCAKDAAAGAVLIASLTALAVGALALLARFT